jgi:hypothetical protein
MDVAYDGLNTKGGKEMRTNIKASEIQAGDILNGETVTQMVNNGAVWIATKEEPGGHEPYRPDFKVNVIR